MSLKSDVKKRVRHLVDRAALPYVEMIRNDVRPGAETPAIAPADAAPAAAETTAGTMSESFHMAVHELRTIELERVPKGARRALSVGAQGRWYFDWFEGAVGPLDEHVGVEAFEPKPDDLPPYATWIPDTADHMDGVATASVDLVYAGQTSEHLWAHELAGFLSEAHRVLREGGLLVLDSPNRLVTGHLFWSHGGHTIELSAGEMRELLELAGFEVLTTRGIWRCVVGGRRLQLEEGLPDATVLVRRAATGGDVPDECFIWWIDARRTERAPRTAELAARIAELFEAHWDVRVCRGLMASPDVTSLELAGRVGRVGETLPFPLHQGTWDIELRLVAGNWPDVDLTVEIAAPGDNLIHVLPLAEATIEGQVARWTIEQPWLLFALSLRIDVRRAGASATLALPVSVHHRG